MDKIDIKSLTYGRLGALLSELGQPAYRTGQIFKWLSLGAGLDEMSDQPKALRALLEERCALHTPKVVARQQSRKDGTVKLLFELHDGNRIETVLMKYHHGWSICLSTQAGCRMGCVFCASFDPESARDLTAGEILDQVIEAGKDPALRENGERISNIVLMGTGEPLDNYDSVMDFLEQVTDSRGVSIGMRHISLSTCGLVPGMDALAEKKLGLTLSVSLHAPSDALRDRLVPVNRKYNIAALMAACKRYFAATGRRISFEYAMIGGINDSEVCAHQLADLLGRMNCHVNLIPLNRVAGSGLEPSSRQDLLRFQEILTGRGINATVRRSLGGDIDAACGQLRKRSATEG